MIRKPMVFKGNNFKVKLELFAECERVQTHETFCQRGIDFFWILALIFIEHKLRRKIKNDLGSFSKK